MVITCFKQYNVLVTDGERVFYQDNFLNRETAEKNTCNEVTIIL